MSDFPHLTMFLRFHLHCTVYQCFICVYLCILFCYMNILLFVCPVIRIDGHLNCWIVASLWLFIMNTAAMSIQAFVWTDFYIILGSFWSALGNSAYGVHMVTLFSFLRICVQGACSILHSHQQYMVVSVSLHPNICYYVIYYNHLSRCEIVSSLWFWFAFPLWLMMLSIFSYV